MRNRQYNLVDATILQRSRTLRQLFIDNMAPFTAFDADLNNAFANNWLARIEECETHPSDDSMDAELQGFTSMMETARAACFAKADDMEFWVKKAFPNKPQVLKEFGLTERKKVRAHSVNTVIWMITMRLVAENYYAAELAAVSMPATLPGELQTAADTLGEKEVAQEMAKRNGLRQTRLRTEKYNGLYHLHVTVHGAAQSVFANDAERKALFHLS